MYVFRTSPTTDVDCDFLFFFYSFQNLGIQCVRRREVRDAIMQRVNRGLNPFSGEIFPYNVMALLSTVIPVVVIRIISENHSYKSKGFHTY